MGLMVGIMEFHSIIVLEKSVEDTMLQGGFCGEMIDLLSGRIFHKFMDTPDRQYQNVMVNHGVLMSQVRMMEISPAFGYLKCELWPSGLMPKSLKHQRHKDTQKKGHTNEESAIAELP